MAIRAALHDAAALAGIIAGEYHATYEGSDRAAYLRALGNWIEGLGGVIEDGPTGTAVRFDARTIALRFGPLSGHS